MHYIVFTDLDGTLLDSSYSFKAALPALKLIKKKKVPLIICTSKTRAEIEEYKRKLKNRDPFISEDGGAIFIPKGYFNFTFPYDKKSGKYFVIELGIPYKKLVSALKKVKQKIIKQKIKAKIISFSDMSALQLSKDAGLSLKEAKFAKQREYDEAFKIKGNKKETKEVLKFIKRAGFNYIFGGRYHHISGKNDKGKAVKILTRLYRKKHRNINIKTIGIGDSENDFSMLGAVEMPYLVQKPDKSYASKKFGKVEGISSVGWNKLVLKLVK